MTSVGMETPLSILTDITFNILRKEKKLLLATLKENNLKNCVNICPEMINTSFSKYSIIDSFVFSGMIDANTKSCPDLYGLIDSFKTN